MSAKYAFSAGVRELRFHLCQTSEHSAATRSFLMRAYPTMKKYNPSTPIMIREAEGVEPKLFARFELGKETMVSLKDLDDKAIEGRVAELVRNATT